MNKVPRSRTVLLLTAAEIPDLADWEWNEILPPEDDPFYDCFDNQVQYLKNNTIIRIKDLCKLMRISTATYYILYPVKPPQNTFVFQNSRGRPTMVNQDDENSLLQHIEACQRAQDCIKPKEAREWLENFILINRGEKLTLDRFWFRRFRERYSARLRIMKIHSRENERCNISLNDVNLYFNNIINYLIKAKRSF